MFIKTSLSRLFAKKINYKEDKLQDFYGFKWVNRQGAPNDLSGYDGSNISPGIYVGFLPKNLQSDTELFGNGKTKKLLYEPPQSPSAKLTILAETIKNLDKNKIIIYTPQFLSQLQGYLKYTASCLDLIYKTSTGKKLIDELQKYYPVFIVPALGGNAVQAGNGKKSLCHIAVEMIDDVNQLSDNFPLLIAEAMQGKSLTEKLSSLAAEINNMKLYSLFLSENNFSANFLGQYFRYNNARINEKVLRDWIFKQDKGAFQSFLGSNNTKQSEIKLVDYFRLAMIILLRKVSPPGKGTHSTVFFNVYIDLANGADDKNKQRPPAIGLAHELIHAYYNAKGTQPGYQIYNFSTVLAELLCVGLGPFADEPFTENKIREEWKTVSAQADVSNQIDAPRRKAYDEANNESEVLKARQNSHTF